jgi:ubiquinone/menaquinone biosynthesis C-methylase UbiE
MSALSLALDTPALAAHYERASVDRQFSAGKMLIERLEIRSGEHVLDVGCGTGLLAEHVASLVGPSGSVVAVDPLPLRIEIAKRKAKSNLMFAVDDAYGLETFADASFDIVYLNAVFHWFPEKLAPLRSFHRLLKPGGWLGVSTGSKEHPNRIHDIKSEVLARAPYRDHVAPEAGGTHRVSAEELKALFTQTGFALESIELVSHVTHHATAEAAIEHAEASSFGNYLGHLPAQLRERARREILEAVDELRTAQGIPQAGKRIIAVAVKE